MSWGFLKDGRHEFQPSDSALIFVIRVDDVTH
jgi:hypothetical protein